MGNRNGSEESKRQTHQFLEGIRERMRSRLAETSLGSLSGDYMGVFSNGKMLRARLAWHVGSAARIPDEDLARIACAVELLHVGSLLHDDVIDGAQLRRDAPAFWVERGIPGAILLGDLLFFVSLDLLQDVDGGRLLPVLVRIAGEICDGESEQELVLRGKATSWEQCVSIARRKTGALFAFTALASGGQDEDLQAALRKAGYALGTAFQLADDILDANGAQGVSDKTLGSDEARDKTTAASAELPSGLDASTYIRNLCVSAEESLAPWPPIYNAWSAYMEDDMWPVLTRNLDLALHTHTS